MECSDYARKIVRDFLNGNHTITELMEALELVVCFHCCSNLLIEDFEANHQGGKCSCNSKRA